MGGKPIKPKRAWTEKEITRAKHLLYRCHLRPETVAMMLGRTKGSLETRMQLERLPLAVRQARAEAGVIARRDLRAQARLAERLAERRLARAPRNEAPTELWQARCPAFRPRGTRDHGNDASGDANGR